ncbi:helix-turn-helix domain-containing protein (plasmid) [Halorussus limi]|uniref:Helix-turn-helix domain-containing protein n=1 Tax=Halorussus limi TaxID=2938695 RepID=A0A8U0I0W4_9EURY|nr:bacterio-opsin activator domain-containing protein [Halorussus limi]UPV76546.1 helix-turn-helix domain-containing protein [Halorussus limi]
MSETESDAVVEVEFRVTDDRYPLVAIPDRLECRTRVEQIVPRGDDTYAIFHCFSGATSDAVLDCIAEYDGIEARTMNDGDDGGVVEVLVTEPADHFVVTLTDAGAIPRELRSSGGEARIVAEVPSIYRVTTVVDRFLDTHPSAEVVARRQKDHDVPVFTRREFEQAVEDRLTDRQREVLEAAFAGGYFDWPRENSGEEVAAELGVTNTTFSQHLRTAERKIFSILVDEWE